MDSFTTPSLTQMLDLIRINEYSKTPKYRQIINSVIKGIEQKRLHLDDKLASVNQMLIEFDISRDTVVKAYDRLKQMGIVESVSGKGYYIKSTNFRQRSKVFLLFNKLSTHKKLIYDSFSTTLGDQVAIDFFVYHNSFRLFKQLVNDHKNEDYTHFAIIPHFLEGGYFAEEVINQIPKDKLIILDKLLEGIDGEYAAVYQDFSKDIFAALTQAKDLLQKYEKLRLIFPPYSYHPIEILDGFEEFCTEYAFEYDIVKDIRTEPISQGEVFINLMEDDLVTLIKRIKGLGLQTGKDVGIISYNETPLKEILLDGITVISSDFCKLGETAAQFILGNEKKRLANPFRLVIRKSL